MRTFNDVMRDLPFRDLWDLLNNPVSVDKKILDCIIAWTKPKRVEEGESFWEIALPTPLFNSKSDLLRRVKEGSVRFNGEKIIDIEKPVSLLEPGWGVIKLGKKNHGVVISNKWSY
jgi:tyrosyl-tRNA synthetase